MALYCWEGILMVKRDGESRAGARGAVRWRRLCIDVDWYGKVIGASVEYYDTGGAKPSSLRVLSRGVWSKRESIEVLSMLLEYPTPNEQLAMTGAPPDGH